MQRITNDDIQGVIGRYTRALRHLGMLGDGEVLVYEEGSKTYGNSFQITKSDGYYAPGTINGFLGWSKREAYQSLYAMALILEDVVYHRDTVENGAQNYNQS